MEPILGIDLGTTNSVVSVWQDGKPVVLPVEEGRKLLPSAVGLDADGGLLVGTPARNQALLAPERTVLSVKRSMGQDVELQLGDRQVTPQEVSAIILRTLKERAEKALGRSVRQAVITVPAFFKETQRAATQDAGEIAGLEVLRIINEPTAAALIYEPAGDHRERLLIYDLGGGTFDVSIVQIEAGVVEVLSSHGDTHLGGDDFDRLLLDHVCEQYRQQTPHVDLRQSASARCRLLQAVEAAKRRLSDEAYTRLAEAFLAEHNGAPLNLDTTLDRSEYEQLIEPLLQKTITSVDMALNDAALSAAQIDKVILVGGSSRTPLVRHMLSEQLGQQPHAEFDPDLCVSLGAAVQGALIAGVDVGPVLVDITPHTLGVRCVGLVDGVETDRAFSPLITRNTALPATRSNLYYTCERGQERVLVDVYQGENRVTSFNEQIGSFDLDGLEEHEDARGEILIRFDLDVNGTLTATAVERATQREKKLTADNAITRFRTDNLPEARQRLAKTFGFTDQDLAPRDQPVNSFDQAVGRAKTLLAKAERLMEGAAAEDIEEIEALMASARVAIQEASEARLTQAADKLEDVLFYLEDA